MKSLSALLSVVISWQESTSAIDDIITKLRGSAPTNNFSVPLIPFAERVNIGTANGMSMLKQEAIDYLTASTISNVVKITCSCGNQHEPDHDHCANQDLTQNGLHPITGHPLTKAAVAASSIATWLGCMEPREQPINGMSYAVDATAPFDENTNFCQLLALLPMVIRAFIKQRTVAPVVTRSASTMAIRLYLTIWWTYALA